MEPSNTHKPEHSVIAVMILCLLFYLFTGANGFIAASISLGLLGLFSKRIAHWVHWVWFNLSQILGLIFPKVILTLIFYLLLTPLALLSRLFGKRDVLRRKNVYESLLVENDDKIDKGYFEKMW